MVVAQSGELCRDVSGRRLFGGNSCGLAGSRFWVAQGLEFVRLQVFARWESQVILRNIADAPLKSAVWFNGRHTASSPVVIESNNQGEDEHVLAEKLRHFVSEADGPPSVVHNTVCQCGITLGTPGGNLANVTQVVCLISNTPSVPSARGWTFVFVPHELVC